MISLKVICIKIVTLSSGFMMVSYCVALYFNRFCVALHGWHTPWFKFFVSWTFLIRLVGRIQHGVFLAQLYFPLILAYSLFWTTPIQLLEGGFGGSDNSWWYWADTEWGVSAVPVCECAPQCHLSHAQKSITWRRVICNAQYKGCNLHFNALCHAAWVESTLSQKH